MFSAPSTHFLQSPPPHLKTSGEPQPNPLYSSRFRPPCATTTTAAYDSAEKTTSFYEVLGIPMGASSQEIKTAYRRLARVCHPDVGLKDSSGEEFMKVQTAYSTLSDPEKRADYDRRLLRRPRLYSVISDSTSQVMTRFSGYGGRSWETDQCW